MSSAALYTVLSIVHVSTLSTETMVTEEEAAIVCTAFKYKYVEPSIKYSLVLLIVSYFWS